MAKKRSTKKKTIRRNTKNVTPQAGSRNAAKNELAVLKEVDKAGRELIASDHGTKGLFDPSTRDVNVLEKRAKAVIADQKRRAPEMAFMLYTLNEVTRFTDKGYTSFDEYVEKELRISAQRAKSLARSWDMFRGLGLDANVSILQRVNWHKFTMLAPLVNNGIVTADNVHTWLPYLEDDGEFGLVTKDIQAKVRAQLAEAGVTQEALKDQQAVERRTISMMVPKDRASEFDKYMQVMGQLQPDGKASIGTTLLNSLAASVMTMQTDDADKLSSQALGVMQAKNLVEDLVPGARMVLVAPQDEDGEYSYENLGVVPAHRAFLTTEDKPRLVIAIDEEEALEELGVDEVIEVPLSLSATYSAAYAPATPADVEDEADEAEEPFEPEPVHIETPGVTEILESAGDEEEDEFGEGLDEEEEEADEEEVDDKEEEEEFYNTRVDPGRIASEARAEIVKAVIAEFGAQGHDRAEFQRQVVAKKKELVDTHSTKEDHKFLIFQDLLTFLYDEADANGVDISMVVTA